MHVQFIKAKGCNLQTRELLAKNKARTVGPGDSRGKGAVKAQRCVLRACSSKSTPLHLQRTISTNSSA